VSAEEAVGDGYVVGVDVNGLVQDLKFHLFSDPFMEDADILSHLLIGRSTSGSSEAESNLLEATAVALGVTGGAEIGKGLGSILSVDDLHLEGSGEKEDMSLVVGKRITNKLYFGYDMNMFSQLGVFRVRYGLAHGFSVETQTSTEATGTDLLYTFER
jgi:translocation and assembly module TamB